MKYILIYYHYLRSRVVSWSFILYTFMSKLTSLYNAMSLKFKVISVWMRIVDLLDMKHDCECHSLNNSHLAAGHNLTSMNCTTTYKMYVDFLKSAVILRYQNLFFFYSGFGTSRLHRRTVGRLCSVSLLNNFFDPFLKLIL